MHAPFGRRSHFTNRKALSAVALLVVAGLIVALGLQAVPIFGGSSSSPTTSQQVAGNLDHAEQTAFVKSWRTMMSGYAARTVQLEQQGRAQAGNTAALIDVYRELEHTTLGVLTQARSLHADSKAAATYQTFIAALEAQDRDLRVVIDAGESNAMGQLQQAISALTTDITRLASAHAAVENALAR
jgi:hypothetical protein